MTTRRRQPNPVVFVVGIIIGVFVFVWSVGPIITWLRQVFWFLA